MEQHRMTNINGESLNGVFVQHRRFVDAIYTILESRIIQIEREDGPALIEDTKNNLIVGTRYTFTTNNETVNGIYDSKYIYTINVQDGTEIHYLMFINATVNLNSDIQLESFVPYEGMQVFPIPLTYGPIKPSPTVIPIGGKRKRRKVTRRLR